MPADKKRVKSRKSRNSRKVRKTRKSRTRKSRRGGGGVKTWAQNTRDSYMVRLKYTLVPKGVPVDVRYVDTPYRFQTYQEARTYAKQLFPCYTYVIEGSRDPATFTGSLKN